MNKTKKEVAALLNITPSRVQQMTEKMILDEDFWYVETKNGKQMVFSDDAVAEMTERHKRQDKGGRPRKHPVSDKLKRPRGRPKKEKAP